MRKIEISSVLLFILTLISLCHTLNNKKIAQAGPKLCSTNEKYEPASKTYRTTKLPEFKIEVDIPSNYRTMKRKDGSVWILHHLDFEHLQCIAKGGGGGRGLYYEGITLVDRDMSIPFKEQAIRLVTNGNTSPGIRIFKHQQSNLSGYLMYIPSPAFSHAGFVGTIDGLENKVLEINAACDCDTKLKDVQSLLNRIRVLQ